MRDGHVRLFGPRCDDYYFANLRSVRFSSLDDFTQHEEETRRVFRRRNEPLSRKNKKENFHSTRHGKREIKGK